MDETKRLLLEVLGRVTNLELAEVVATAEDAGCWVTNEECEVVRVRVRKLYAAFEAILVEDDHQGATASLDETLAELGIEAPGTASDRIALGRKLLAELTQ